MLIKRKMKFGLGRSENIVGKRENAGYQHFLFFPQCFPKSSFQGSLKVEIQGEEFNVFIVTVDNLNTLHNHNALYRTSQMRQTRFM